MCHQCLEAEGFTEPIDTPATRAAAALVNRLHEEFDDCGGGVGAALHIVTDDYNVHDDSIDYCESVLETHWSVGEANTPERAAELIALERAIIAALRPLSLQERVSALNLELIG